MGSKVWTAYCRDWAERLNCSKLVSVVVPVYNAEQYVNEALLSLVAQTYSNLEIIAVDDGSTDGSAALVSAIGDPRIKLIRLSRNHGQSVAQNVGIEHAEGEFVAILGADDVAHIDRIHAQVAYLEANPSVGVVGTSYHLCDQDGVVIGTFRVPVDPVSILWRLMLHNPIGAPTVMIRRDALRRAGVFDPDLRFAEDLELWGRLAAVTRIGGLDLALTKYRVHSRSLSRMSPSYAVSAAVASAHQQNIKGLIGLMLPKDVLIVLSGGEPKYRPDLREVYAAVQQLAVVFMAKHARSQQERRRVFEEVTVTLQRLARLADEKRLCAIATAAHIAWATQPMLLASGAALRLSVKTLPPRSLRSIAASRNRSESANSLDRVASPGVSVAQVGPYPPPFGGVSVHIKRLHERLSEAGVRSAVYSGAGRRQGNPPGVHSSRRPWAKERVLLQTIARTKEDVVHCHEGWQWCPALLVALARGQKIVMTFHNQELVTSFLACSLHVRAAAWILCRSRRVRWIAVSDSVKDGLLQLGVPAERVLVLPAFLRPAMPTVGPRGLAREVTEFAAKHKPLLVTYGWKYWMEDALGDVYGFDLCVRSLASLRKRFPHAGLIMSIPGGGDEPDLAAFERDLEQLAVRHHVLVLKDALEDSMQLWARADVFLRASRTDGDAVSVREALSLGVPVVASSAAVRPRGVRIFLSGDAASLESAIREVLASGAAGPAASPGSEPSDGFNALLGVYRDLGGG